MPNDLERAFAALSDDTTRQARLAPAAAVRRRGDRQTLTRSLAGVAAAVVLVAGALVGSRLVLTDKALPPLPPAESTAPTSAPPSVTPSPSASAASSPTATDEPPAGPETEEAGTPAIPQSVPVRAFLKRSETNGANLKLLGTPATPVRLCAGAGDFGSEDRVGVRGTVEILVAGNTVPAELYEDEDAGKDPDLDYWPVALISNSVTVYRGGGAGAYLDEVRAMARNCPKGGNGATYRSLGTLSLGDESVLIEGSSPARDDNNEVLADGSRVYRYFAEVRIADTVVTMHYGGYEDAGAIVETVKRADARSLARKAVERARNWRG